MKNKETKEIIQLLEEELINNDYGWSMKLSYEKKVPRVILYNYNSIGQYIELGVEVNCLSDVYNGLFRCLSYLDIDWYMESWIDHCITEDGKVPYDHKTMFKISEETVEMMRSLGQVAINLYADEMDMEGVSIIGPNIISRYE